MIQFFLFLVFIWKVSACLCASDVVREADDSFSPGNSSFIRSSRWFWWNERAEFRVHHGRSAPFLKLIFSEQKANFFFHRKFYRKQNFLVMWRLRPETAVFSLSWKKNSNHHFFTRQKRMRHSFSSCSTIQRDNELHDIEFIDTVKWNETYFGAAKSLVERCARAQLSHSHSIALKHAKYCNEKRRMPYKSVP